MNGRGAPGMVGAIVAEYHLSLLFMRSQCSLRWKWGVAGWRPRGSMGLEQRGILGGMAGARCRRATSQTLLAVTASHYHNTSACVPHVRPVVIALASSIINSNTQSRYHALCAARSICKDTGSSCPELSHLFTHKILLLIYKRVRRN